MGLVFREIEHEPIHDAVRAGRINGGLSELVFSILRSVESVVIVLREHPHHAVVLLYVLMVGGMFGIIVRSGGIKGFADFLSAKVRTRRRGMITTWFLGILFSMALT